MVKAENNQRESGQLHVRKDVSPEVASGAVVGIVFRITDSQVDDLLAILDEAIGAVERALPAELRG